AFETCAPNNPCSTALAFSSKTQLLVLERHRFWWRKHGPSCICCSSSSLAPCALPPTTIHANPLLDSFISATDHLVTAISRLLRPSRSSYDPHSFLIEEPAFAHDINHDE